MTSHCQTSIIVSNLHPLVTEGQMFRRFSLVSTVKYVHIPRRWVSDKKTSLCLSYVTFTTSDGADKALKLHLTPLNGRPMWINLKAGQPPFARVVPKKLILKNLDDKLTNTELYGILFSCGHVISITSTKTNGKRSAIVEFEQESYAAKAKATLHGMKSSLSGKEMYISDYIERPIVKPTHVHKVLVGPTLHDVSDWMTFKNRKKSQLKVLDNEHSFAEEKKLIAKLLPAAQKKTKRKHITTASATDGLSIKKPVVVKTTTVSSALNSTQSLGATTSEHTHPQVKEIVDQRKPASKWEKKKKWEKEIDEKKY